jgi:putative phosphoesterase
MVAAAFQGVDLILHAGDLVVPDVLAELRSIAPVEAVAGNNDPAELVAELGTARLLELAGYRIGLTHGHLGTGKTTPERALSQFPGADCVVFGHSHMPYCQWHGETLAFNPGSATDKRRAPSCSIGILYLEPEGIRTGIVDI